MGGGEQGIQLALPIRKLPARGFSQNFPAVVFLAAPKDKHTGPRRFRDFMAIHMGAKDKGKEK